MKETNTLIVGASVSGLASASSLTKQGIEYIIIEKESQVATPWRNHYDRLHLHTNKNLSNLPYKKFGNAIPNYPTRQQVVDYLTDYQQEFNINPIFNTEAKSIKREGDYWITKTTNGNFRSKFVIVATGPFGKPKAINFKGMDTFPGKILHSYGYKTGRDFKGQKVLVVGFGNSACEIAIDIYEQGAYPSMAVRSPVNVLPRDILGIPILQLSLLMTPFPPKLADAINAPLMRLLTGDITKLGLKKLPYGPLEQIQKDGTVPLLDIGTIKHIREGHIKIYGNIDYISGKTVCFIDGKREDFDTIVAGIGYYRDYAEIIDADKNRFEDLKVSINKQKYFGKDGLYFCGFWIAPTGQFREIALDAQKIAKDIALKEKAVSTH
ncbi:flavin-containing monooxygenase [Flavihumibacter profundi]|uniref:flavin-containing monooxygenase n=1 Tax=Flavihumibacter profundi TaxID=2716883 RepID=UPI001CC4E0CB|nr:NAD(P)/FAD-dependent oxidoreductase [Flavihumibacter profundi]MBZ5856826.1 NAD(P)/FAD-dependent oxidoreductase [Flavihumibacter profundi]